MTSLNRKTAPKIDPKTPHEQQQAQIDALFYAVRHLLQQRHDDPGIVALEKFFPEL